MTERNRPKNRNKRRLDLDLTVEQPKKHKSVIQLPSDLSAAANITSENGNIYLEYPPGTIGGRMPCLLCQHPITERYVENKAIDTNLCAL